MSKRVLELSGKEALEVLKALASEARLEILSLLEQNILNVNELAEALGLSQPTASAHIQRLEEVGLIHTSLTAGNRGTQKTSSRLYDQILINFPTSEEGPEDNVIEISMPVGVFTDVRAQPTCGLASERSIIGILDDPQAFLVPERVSAHILWFAKGHAEYRFPNSLPPRVSAERLDLSMEICSEVAGYQNDWPSDVTLWINSVPVGTWTCPGDFGGERGRLNPSWWQDRYSQFGLLKSWSVAESGSYIDGVQLSKVRIGDLGLEEGQPIHIRIGNREDAEHVGGVTLFGRKFGNYAQDLVMRITYRPNGRPQGTGAPERR